ncbi:thiol reductant ABC exporter subunit CydC [Metabacillus indicus]|uniref:thiol reductant ABC exporter subunit CydC n=1 Tax=Metabacillus indicus TaxID=246786 RepID=UPI000492EC40|nr:thiol reductant ABC exporter subunit CydC [Metabacillus indicus]KEZ50217.1 ABC transporter ATP-binding protein [Metabacillus indicus LMG 22858]
MKDISHIVRLMWNEKRDIWLTVLLGFLAGITGIALFASSGYLISKAALLPPLYTLTVMLALLKLAGIARALSRYAERLVSHRATFTILKDVRASFYEKLEPMVPRIFNTYRSGDLLSRIVGDVENLQNFFLRVFYPPVVFLFVFLSTIAFVSFYSVPIAMMLLAGMVLTGMAIPAYFAYRQKKWDDSVRDMRSLFSSEAAEFYYGYRDLKIYGQTAEKEEKLRRLSDLLADKQAQLDNRVNQTQSINTAITVIINCGILALGAYQAAAGELNGLYLAMLVMISLNVFEFAVPMAAFPVYYEESRRASKRLYSFPEEPVLQEEKKQDDITQDGFSIHVKNVHYSYGAAGSGLKGVTVAFPQGSKTAVVGPSGSGKSTLLMLLMKMYEPESGEITLNEKPLADIISESLWEGCNIVLQDNHFFYGTIRENLLIAVKEEAEDADLLHALKEAGLENKRLDDLVLEKGDNLSGGEKQKLAIARILLKKAGLWLLDEPTASMDLLSEQSIHNTLFEHARHQTLILVSHRLTGLEKMDQIIVMDQGRILEKGPYEELMRRKGYFYGLKQIEQEVLV